MSRKQNADSQPTLAETCPWLDVVWALVDKPLLGKRASVFVWALAWVLLKVIFYFWPYSRAFCFFWVVLAS